MEHKKALQKSASIKVAVAILMIIGGTAIMAAGASSAQGADSVGALGIVGLLIRIVGLVPWFWGLADYSKSKGQSPVLAVLGLLSCIGLLILVVLPDKYVVRQPQAYDPNSNYPR